MPASRRLLLVAAVAVVVAFVVSGCGASPDGVGGRAGPTVVATTTQLGDLARQVAGNRASIRQILQPNSDPHAYEPRPSDVRAVAAATIVVRSGGDLDAWLGDVLRNAGSDATTVTIIDALHARRAPDGIDPHWWQDPRNAVIAVERIRDALVAADRRGRSTYDANAARYVAKLRRLDAAIAACMSRIPRARRRLVTDHDALGYYADRYAIDVIGTVIPALSSQAEASAGEAARLVRTIRAAGVATIFSESSVNAKLTQAIARDAGAKVGPALYADSLGATGTPGATLAGSLRFNTEALVAGLSDGRQHCALPG